MCGVYDDRDDGGAARCDCIDDDDGDNCDSYDIAVVHAVVCDCDHDGVADDDDDDVCDV